MANAKLREEIRRRLTEPGLSLAKLQKITGIDRSQLSRFRSGKFRRLSQNLRIVCRTLQIEIAIATPDPDLVHAVHAVWDGTPDGKRRLVALLKTLEDWR
jgi:transcriptional regulator with XRE-family HTH domain